MECLYSVEITINKIDNNFVFRFGNYLNGKIKTLFIYKTKKLNKDLFNSMIKYNDQEWNNYFNSKINAKHQLYFIKRKWKLNNLT